MLTIIVPHPVKQDSRDDAMRYGVQLCICAAWSDVGMQWGAMDVALAVLHAVHVFLVREEGERAVGQGEGGCGGHQAGEGRVSIASRAVFEQAFGACREPRHLQCIRALSLYMRCMEQSKSALTGVPLMGGVFT